MAGTGLQSVLQGIFDLTAQQIQIAHDKRMQDRQSALNEAAARENDLRTRKLYMDLQSPEALRKQYEKAGYNPALLYSQMGGSIGSAGSSQGVGTANSNLGGITAPDLGAIFEILNLKKDLEVKDVTKKNIEADTRNKDANTNKTSYEIKEINQKIDNMVKEGHLTDAQADKVRKEIDVMDTQIDEIVSRINLNRKQEDKIDAEIAKTNFETNFLLPSVKALNDFQSGKTEVEVFGQKYNSQEIGLLMHNTYLQLYHFIATMLGAENVRDIKATSDKVWGFLVDTWNKLFEGKEMPKEMKSWMDRNKYGKDPFSWQDK